jgi:hypothetical protein
MNLEEFIENEQILKDMNLEILLKQKDLFGLMQDRDLLWKNLRLQARVLKITTIEGKFVLS